MKFWNEKKLLSMNIGIYLINQINWIINIFLINSFIYDIKVFANKILYKTFDVVKYNTGDNRMKNNQVLKSIIGDYYNEFLEKLLKDVYENFPEVKINNTNIIIENYCKLVLAFGFNSKISKERIIIETLENDKLIISTKEFKERYNTEIKMVYEYINTITNF